MNTFEQDLKLATTYHGHLCSGQILGVRMARLGCKLLGIDDPKSFRDLIVYIECDRCLTDAIGSVTGCKLGKRTLKWKDFGKSAATFLNLQTQKAYRIYKKTHKRAPQNSNLVEFFNTIPDEEMFSFKEVKVIYNDGDLPGKPVEAVFCSICKEEVTDRKHYILNEKPVCKYCYGDNYYIDID